MTDIPVVVGIDAGGSSTRWRVLGADGRPRGQGRLGPLSGLIFDDESRALAANRLDEVAAAVLAVGNPQRAVAAVTGLSDDGEPAHWLAKELAQRLGLKPGSVRVLNDMEVAYRASFAPGQGVLVYGGTGSIAYHLPARGQALRAGGHGFLIDDAGGGFSIGRGALRRVLRETDRLGRTLRSPLADGIYRAVGGEDWDSLRRYVYGGGRSAVAALAPIVAQAALEGDVDALALLDRAGRELGRLADILLARLDAPLPAVLAGGVTRLGDPLIDAFRDVLTSAVAVTVEPGEPVDAAARLALGG